MDQLNVNEPIVKSKDVLESIKSVSFAHNVEKADFGQTSLHQLLTIDHVFSHCSDHLDVEELVPLCNRIGVNLIQDLQEGSKSE